MYTKITELKAHDVEGDNKPFYQIQPIDSKTAKVVEIGKLNADTELSIFIDNVTKPEFLEKEMELSFVSCIHPTVKQMSPIIQLQFMKNKVPFAYLSYNFIKEDTLNDTLKGYYNITYHENHDGVDRYKIVEGTVDWVSVDNMFAELLAVVS